MKLLVQNFLQNNSLKSLEEKHGVYASLSKDNRKISLNYDQIETKDNDILSLDCRGLILSKLDFNEFILSDGKLDKSSIIGDTQIVAFGMRRFFNYEQEVSAKINWNDPKLKVMEKLDGTLIQVYFYSYTNEWCVSTRKITDADLLMNNGIYTFRNLFEKAILNIGLSFEEFTSSLDKKITYCFELTSPFNKILVDYKNTKITLIAARNIDYFYNSLNEINISNINICNIPSVNTYSLSNLSDIINWVSSQKPMEHEGVVVIDSKFNRIKIKNSAYVALSRVRNSLITSERNCLELILLEKDDDVISILPKEIIDIINNIKQKLINTIKLYDETYIECKSVADTINLGDKKTFALIVHNQYLWSAPFFGIFSGKYKDMKDFISKNKNSHTMTWTNSFLDKILMIIKYI